MISDIIIANVVASGCLVLLVYLFDLNEKEPRWTLVRIFILSILATFLFGKLKAFLFHRYAWEFTPLIDNYLVAGFFEELLKFLIVMIFVWRLKSFNEETDGIIYYLIVAAGFTVLENVGYSFQFVINPYVYGMTTGEMGLYHSALQKIVLLRAVSGHVLVNVVSGYFLGLARRHHRWWLLVPGFVASVLLHGAWNQTAMMGFIGFYALALVLLDGVLFYSTIRMSFYFKFIRRLKYRIQDLIRQAKEAALSPDVIILMESIRRSVGVLRQMEGSVLTEKAKDITQTLPARVNTVSLRGEGGLLERLLHVNGILHGGSQDTSWRFWIGLFFMFSVSGFFVLMLLMNLM